ncbi:TPA: hypothetical protein ACX6RO_001835 [Photobacterium damselae]
MLTQTLSIVLLTDANMTKSSKLLTINTAITTDKNTFYFSNIPVRNSNSTKYFAPLMMDIDLDNGDTAAKHKSFTTGLVRDLHRAQHYFCNHVDEFNGQNSYRLEEQTSGLKTKFESDCVCSINRRKTTTPILSGLVTAIESDATNEVFSPRHSDFSTVIINSDKNDLSGLLTKANELMMLKDANNNTSNEFAVYLNGKVIYCSIPGWEDSDTTLDTSRYSHLFNTDLSMTHII